MFEKLTSGLTKVFEKLTGTGYLTEASVDEALQQVRVVLLDADVALPVVKEFSKLVKERATGEKILKSISPGQLVIKIVQDCLVEVLSNGSSELNLKCAPPAVILMTGLQGSGKTTTSAKLASKLKSSGKNVLLASIDIARPAAQEQLQMLAHQIEVDYFQIENKQPEVLKLTKEILKRAQSYDVLIVDTAGRLHVDDNLMKELKQVHALLSPIETLLIVDSLTGQDAFNIAEAFGNAIQVTGLILTRMDSDARGGAALSLGYMTKRPIKFLGVGERISDLEQFHADRLASRILDMGDVVSLVEKAKEAIDEAESEAMLKRMESGNFDLNMMADQLRGIKKMGGLSSLMKLIPGLNKMSQQLPVDMSEDAVNKSLAIISSMTKEERAIPDVFNASRKKRVAAGSGTSIHDVNKLLKQFTHMSKALRRMKNFEGNPSALTRHLPQGVKDLFS